MNDASASAASNWISFVGVAVFCALFFAAPRFYRFYHA
jgi:hypothetical protein